VPATIEEVNARMQLGPQMIYCGLMMMMMMVVTTTTMMMMMVTTMMMMIMMMMVMIQIDVVRNKLVCFV